MPGTTLGRVKQLWRYPVKSMRGEECPGVDVGEKGVVGDRAFALIDVETGKVVSAKNPRRWPGMFDHRAVYDGPVPGVATVGLPDGTRLNTDDPRLEGRLSETLGRDVRLARAPVAGAEAEGYWPDEEWLSDRDTEFQFTLPPGTFFDGALIHLLTTATLDRLAEAAPDSRFDVRRFRPNLLIETVDGAKGFVEDAWIGRSIRVGEVLLRIEGHCPRCVMTTLPLEDLPRDPHILRVAYRENAANVGVYARVERVGRVKRGDEVRLGDAQ